MLVSDVSPWQNITFVFDLFTYKYLKNVLISEINMNVNSKPAPVCILNGHGQKNIPVSTLDE